MKTIFSHRKRIIAGVIAGAFLLGIGLNGVQTAADAAQYNVGRAAAKQVETQAMPERPPFELNPERAAQHIHDQFGVDKGEVQAALAEHRDFRDVGQAAMLAKISGKSFASVLSLKTNQNTWEDVGKQIGVTRQQVRAQLNGMLAQRISQAGNISTERATELLDNGYCGYDIAMAGKLANASGEDIQSVLDRKKINNRWEDVAEELGLPRDAGAQQQDCGALGHRMESDMMSAFIEPDSDGNASAQK